MSISKIARGFIILAVVVLTGCQPYGSDSLASLKIEVTNLDSRTILPVPVAPSQLLYRVILKQGGTTIVNQPGFTDITISLPNLVVGTYDVEVQGYFPLTPTITSFGSLPLTLNLGAGVNPFNVTLNPKQLGTGNASLNIDWPIPAGIENADVYLTQSLGLWGSPLPIDMITGVLTLPAGTGLGNFDTTGPTTGFMTLDLSDLPSGTWYLRIDLQDISLMTTSLLVEAIQVFDGLTSQKTITLNQNQISSPPVAPMNLVANMSLDGSKVDLSWTDNSMNEEGFYIYSSLDLVTPIALLGPGVTNAQIDFSLWTLGGSEDLYVASYNAFGESLSTFLTVRPITASFTPLNPTDGEIGVFVPLSSIGYSSSFMGVDNYDFYLSTDSVAVDDLTAPVYSELSPMLSTSIPTLANDTTYYWRLKVTNTNGMYLLGPRNSFTTLPNAPASLNATANSGTSTINLTWSDLSGVETGYRVYRNFIPLPDLAANTTSYADTGLTVGTAYTYSVVALGGGNESNPSNTVNQTLLGNFAGAPTPADLSTGVATNPAISLPSVAGATNYELHINTSSTIVDSWAGNTAQYTNSTPNFTPTALTPNTQYFWLIVATADGGLTKVASPRYSFTTVLPPPPVSSLNVSFGTGATVSWTYDSTPLPTTYFKILRNSVLIYTTANGITSYNDPSLTGFDGNIYNYEVIAVNSLGLESSPMSFNYVHMQPPALSVPSNTQTNVNPRISLTWTATGGANEYDVYVSATLANVNTLNPLAKVTTTPTTSTFFQFTGGFSTPYYWCVVARNTTSGAFTQSPVWSFTTRQAGLYVSSTGGSDTNSGIAASPLQSMGEAFFRVVQGDDIYLTGGLYETTQTLILPAGITSMNIKGSYLSSTDWTDPSRTWPATPTIIRVKIATPDQATLKHVGGNLTLDKLQIETGYTAPGVINHAIIASGGVLNLQAVNVRVGMGVGSTAGSESNGILLLGNAQVYTTSTSFILGDNITKPSIVRGIITGNDFSGILHVNSSTLFDPAAAPPIQVANQYIPIVLTSPGTSTVTIENAVFKTATALSGIDSSVIEVNSANSNVIIRNNTIGQVINDISLNYGINVLAAATIEIDKNTIDWSIGTKDNKGDQFAIKIASFGYTNPPAVRANKIAMSQLDQTGGSAIAYGIYTSVASKIINNVIYRGPDTTNTGTSHGIVLDGVNGHLTDIYHNTLVYDRSAAGNLLTYTGNVLGTGMGKVVNNIFYNLGASMASIPLTFTTTPTAPTFNNNLFKGNITFMGLSINTSNVGTLPSPWAPSNVSPSAVLNLNVSTAWFSTTASTAAEVKQSGFDLFTPSIVTVDILGIPRTPSIGGGTSVGAYEQD